MQPNPYLSVAIPTFNRQAELIQCLESIVPQAQALAIRIYISDNASPYDVFSTLEPFRAAHPLIVCHRNPVNVGLDANLRQVISMAESEYVWTFSDDDRMAEGALARVLSFCEEGRYDFILPDRELRSPDMLHSIATGSKINGVAAPTEYRDPVAVFVRHGYLNFTFLGCFVIKLSSWRRVNREKYDAISWFQHTCILAEMLLEGTSLVLPDQLIQIRSGNITYSDHWYLVWKSHFPRALCALPAAYPLECRRKVLLDHYEGSIPKVYRMMLVGRSNGAINWKTRKAFLEPYQGLRATHWILAIYVALLVLAPLFRVRNTLRARLLRQSAG